MPKSNLTRGNSVTENYKPQYSHWSHECINTTFNGFIDLDKYPLKLEHEYCGGEDQYEYYVYKLRELTVIECETGHQEFMVEGNTVNYQEAIQYLRQERFIL